MKPEFKKTIIEWMAESVEPTALFESHPEMNDAYEKGELDDDEMIEFALDMKRAMLIKINKDE